MENINIESGIKSYTINNDESRIIKFNPTDSGIIIRMKDMGERIDKKMAELKVNFEIKDDGTVDKENIESFEDLSKFICDEIDYIFNAKISEVVFENTSPFATVDGIPYFERFIDSIKPILEQEIKKEKIASAKRMQKYTEKYQGGK